MFKKEKCAGKCLLNNLCEYRKWKKTMILRSQVYKYFNNNEKKNLKRTQVLFLNDQARGSIVKGPKVNFL